MVLRQLYDFLDGARASGKYSGYFGTRVFPITS